MTTKNWKFRLKYIKDNLTTRPKWKLQDYKDFYERDILWLINKIERLDRLLTRKRKEWLKREEYLVQLFKKVREGVLWKNQHTK